MSRRIKVSPSVYVEATPYPNEDGRPVGYHIEVWNRIAIKDTTVDDLNKLIVALGGTPVTENDGKLDAQ